MIALAAFLLTQGPPSSLPIQASPGEKHLTNIRQLTFGGQNAEAYWNVEGTKLVYQTRLPQYPDEQIYEMNADGSEKRLVSTGEGRTTCSYYSPDGKWIYFSSTHATEKGAQKPLDFSKGYVWMVNPAFAMYRVEADARTIDPEGMSGTGKGYKPPKFDPVVRKKGHYVAETTISPNGDYMVWTSDVSGDLEIYRSDLKGGNVRQLTNFLGYDGGPFVSWDGKKIVFRRSSPQNPEEVNDYKGLLKEHLIRPTKLEIWIMDADGRNMHRVTNLGGASFAPFLAPDNKTVIFSSNYEDPKGREFDLYRINLDGSGLERITTAEGFDGFPMFTRDGKRLVWASNRNGKEAHETNVFVADWVE